MDKEKIEITFVNIALLQGSSIGLIDLLESGKEIPMSTRSILSDMLKGESTGIDYKFIIRRRDGKRGRPKMPHEELLVKIDLGNRVTNLMEQPGDYDGAVDQAAKEFGVSDRTAKTAYAFVRDAGQKQSRIEKNV